MPKALWGVVILLSALFLGWCALISQCLLSGWRGQA